MDGDTGRVPNDDRACLRPCHLVRARVWCQGQGFRACRQVAEANATAIERIQLVFARVVFGFARPSRGLCLSGCLSLYRDGTRRYSTVQANSPLFVLPCRECCPFVAAAAASLVWLLFPRLRQQQHCSLLAGLMRSSRLQLGTIRTWLSGRKDLICYSATRRSGQFVLVLLGYFLSG